jgi:uncharacterized protein (TIGR02271 family)
MGTETHEYVDARYEDRSLAELPDTPVEALRGLGRRGGEALRKAFGVKTIRDLALNDFVLKAQEIVLRAEGPGALPAVRAGRTEAAGSAQAEAAGGARAGAAGGARAEAAARQEERPGGQTMTRSEEELDVGTERVGRGQAGVRKRVVTEQQQRTVPVEREELRVEREPIPAGAGDADAEVADDELTLELRKEQPVVSKQVVPKERVRVGKQVVRDEAHVSEPVRKEQVEVDEPDGER